MRTHLRVVAGGFVTWTVLCGGILSIRADELATQGRAIMSKWQNVVVTVKVTSKQSMGFGGQQMSKRDNTAEVAGTVIDPSGLIVLSLFATDPSEFFNQMKLGGDEGGKAKWEVSITDIKIIFPDGQEIPGKIVLRDKDLDLLFLRPTVKLTKPLAALDLSKMTKPQILDQMIVLSQLGKVGGRVPHVTLGRVQSIVEKPRTLYVPGNSVMEGGLGVPAFTMDGKIIGLLVFRMLSSGLELDMAGMFGGAGRQGALGVILPAADILEVAKQAPGVEEKIRK